LALAGLAPGACLEPTQLTLDISTDALCVDTSETQVFLGRLGAFETAPAATTQACSDDGHVGTLVVVPSQGKNQSVAVEVVLGVGKSTASCIADGYKDGCIVARRSLNYVPHTALELPIRLDMSCLDIPCGATETCSRGKCYSAELPDPEACSDPAGCDERSGAGGASPTTEGPTSTPGNSGDGGGAAGDASTAGNTGGGSAAGDAGTGGNTGNGGTAASDAGSTGDGGSTAGDAGTAGAGGSGPTFDPAHTLVVTTTADVTDGDTSSVLALAETPGADGQISLREAILAANATPIATTPNSILFGVPGSGPFTLKPLTALPPITRPVVVDGLSQSDSEHWIELNGSNSIDVGLHLFTGSDGSTIRGMVLTEFSDAGILLELSGSHRVLGNYVGVRPDGVTAAANYRGLRLSESANNLIGGKLATLAAEGNVISGNTLRGILVEGAASQANRIVGNLVGLSADGLSALGNGADGIYLRYGPSNNTLGSSKLDERNVISANGESGVRMLAASGGPTTNDNLVIGNYIGCDVACSSNAGLGNTFAGVRLQQAVNRNRIGGVLAGEGNIIVQNGWAGVWIGNAPTPQKNAVLGNHLRQNGGLGIELWQSPTGEGVTLNDVGDVDTGSNSLLNYPEFTAVSHASANVSVDFSLDVPAGTYRIEFFESTAADDICAIDPANSPNCLSDASGTVRNGEGWSLVHAEVITHTGSGSEAFHAVFAADSSMILTATCTEYSAPSTYGATSEFSRAVPMTFP
jgi:hypothetical protein